MATWTIMRARWALQRLKLPAHGVSLSWLCTRVSSMLGHGVEVTTMDPLIDAHRDTQLPNDVTVHKDGKAWIMSHRRLAPRHRIYIVCHALGHLILDPAPQPRASPHEHAARLRQCHPITSHHTPTRQEIRADTFALLLSHRVCDATASIETPPADVVEMLARDWGSR